MVGFWVSVTGDFSKRGGIFPFENDYDSKKKPKNYSPPSALDFESHDGGKQNKKENA